MRNKLKNEGLASLIAAGCMLAVLCIITIGAGVIVR